MSGKFNRDEIDTIGWHPHTRVDTRVREVREEGTTYTTSEPLNQPPCRDSWRATCLSPRASVPPPSLLLSSYDSFGSDLLDDPFTSPPSTFPPIRTVIKIVPLSFPFKLRLQNSTWPLVQQVFRPNPRCSINST